VGQRLVSNWPVLDLGHQPEVPREEWSLEVCGLVENPVTLDWEALRALPQSEDVSDFHCVTTWSRLDNRWGGVTFRDLAAHVVPVDEARYLHCTGYDTAPGTDIPYTTNLSLERALDPDVMLVHTWEGEPLPREHGGPVRMITPRLYAWKGTKWIRRIEFLAEDRLGFWEARGYSNTAEPWFNDRFSSR
jgi:DMSO/TMAO reductase YedYZ molybdopterin-dependent catalytic subunit